MINGDYDLFIKQLERNTFLIKDGEGVGEGIVIKNYEFANKYGRVTWAKIVTNEFKEKHKKTMGGSVIKNDSLVEEKILDDFCTIAFIEKEYAKIVNENNGWQSKYIPTLFNKIYYELVNEELWHIIKKYKNPKINFKLLFNLITNKVKTVKCELF